MSDDLMKRLRGVMCGDDPVIEETASRMDRLPRRKARRTKPGLRLLVDGLPGVSKMAFRSAPTCLARHEAPTLHAIEGTKMLYQILNRFTRAVQVEVEISCHAEDPASLQMGLAVRAAIRIGANLRGANLGGANLGGADLGGADLRDANLRVADLIDGGLRSDGYRFVGWKNAAGVLMLRAGCRNFTLPQARLHWLSTRGGTPLAHESLEIVDHIERMAAIRGWAVKTGHETESARESPSPST